MALLVVVRGEAASAQSPLDRVDPALVHEQLEPGDPAVEHADAPPVLDYRLDQLTDVAETLVVGAVRVEGATVLSASVFTPVIDSYVGRALSPADLRALASDIAGVARQRGYGLATAWIPQQRIERGILRVMLDEGRIDAVEATGGGAAEVERALAPLVRDTPVTTAELERRLLIAGDISGVWIKRTRLERRGGFNVLRVDSGRQRVRARAFADNWGSELVGPVRLRFDIDFNGLIAADDRLSVGGALTPLDPGELALVTLGYAKALGRNGTEVSVESYYARTNAGGHLKESDVDGETAALEISVSHPLRRTRASSFWLDLDIGYLASRQSRRDVELRYDRIAAFTAGLFGTLGDSDGRLRGRVSLRRGFDILHATDAGDRLASRRDAGGAFTKLEFWAAYDRRLAGPFEIALQATGQIADGPLLLSEEMGLGGRYFLRGYDYREASGDKGLAGLAELRFRVNGAPSPLRNLEFYGFADAGSVGNYQGGAGSGSLASAGGGVRAGLDHGFEIGFEVGIPLVEAAGVTGRDPRFSLTASKRF